jgi:hypothetical protein
MWFLWRIKRISLESRAGGEICETGLGVLLDCCREQYPVSAYFEVDEGSLLFRRTRHKSSWGMNIHF